VEIAIPVVGTVAEAAALCPTADVFVNFASFRSAFDSTMEALVEPTIRTVAVIAEGVPEVGQRGGRGVAGACPPRAAPRAAVHHPRPRPRPPPQADTKKLIAYAKANNKIVIGPATVGGIQAGAFRIGDAAGTADNLVACGLHAPGSVGFVSKSGGMSNEMYSVLARATDGLYEGVAIGGDSFPGSTLSDHALRYEAIPAIKLIVVLGELGG
jgi:ATP citrate (pro-S)-lyase